MIALGFEAVCALFLCLDMRLLLDVKTMVGPFVAIQTTLHLYFLFFILVAVFGNLRQGQYLLIQVVNFSRCRSLKAR